MGQLDQQSRKHLIENASKLLNNTFSLKIRSTLCPNISGTNGSVTDSDKCTLAVKIEYHSVGDTWWQPLLSYGKIGCCRGFLGFFFFFF